MRSLQITSWIIGISQLVLGGLYLLVPMQFLQWQGLQTPPMDITYPLSMLSARFIVYGLGMFVIARAPRENRFWLMGMIVIQVIDLTGGVMALASNLVSVKSAFAPMFNASLFIILMLVTGRKVLFAKPAA